MTPARRNTVWFVLVVVLAMVATSAYTRRVNEEATEPIRAATAELDRTVAQRRRDLIEGCERSATRVESNVIAYASTALADGIVSRDPDQPPRTRKARRASSDLHWEAAAIIASTLVDCSKAYPPDGKPGVSVIDFDLLRRLRVKLERRLGKIDARALRRVEQIIEARTGGG